MRPDRRSQDGRWGRAGAARACLLAAGALCLTHVAQAAEPRQVRALAAVTCQRPPSDARLLLMEDAYAGEAPYMLTVEYEWRAGGFEALHFVGRVAGTDGPWMTSVAPGVIRIEGTTAVRLGQYFRNVVGWQRSKIDLQRAAREWPDFLEDQPQWSGYKPLDFYCAQLWLLSDPARLALEDLGTEDVNGRPARKLRLTPGQPVILYEPHRLTHFTLWRDEERGTPLRWEGYAGDELAVEAEHGEFREVSPGRWAALRVEERWHPGTFAHRVERSMLVGNGTVTRQETYRQDVPGARETTQFSVVADGLVVPKDIRHYDDRDRLLMQAEFLSYEIEYDDGTVVYAEPE